MKKYQYKCKLLSDIIITSDAATEAPSDALDYIPGSKFLGIIAGKLYDESQHEKTLDLFHNGTVRYGDATLFHEGYSYLKSPFSWYYEKGKSAYEEVYIHHLMESTDKQLEQVRTGYFSPEVQTMISLNKNFSLKSAQDSKKRRSKDGQMFGYQSLKAGTEWVFEITDKKGAYAEEIKSVLEGKHRIGRSRSAEYGLVEIEYVKEVSEAKPFTTSGQLVLYARSNLCFVDEKTGSYTAQPTAKQLCGDENAKILWEKCQVRSRNYKTWNRHRGNKDADRIIIERGSVFILELNKELSSEFFNNGIGSHKSEGFGEVMVNPDFLNSSGEILNYSFKERRIHTYQESVVGKGDKDDVIFNVLQNIHQRNDFDYQIDKAVNKFKKDHHNIFEGISNSQWGTIRNYGKHLNNRNDFMTMVFDTKSGYVYSGQSETEWRQKNRRSILKKHLEELEDKQFFPFILKLSSQMSKRN